MRLPNYDQALVSQRKITEYLLSLTHRDGRSKAQFFTRFGFSADAWEMMAKALLRHAYEHEVVKIEDSPFGTRYVVEGILFTPDDRTPLVRSVWFVETENTIPRFITAYPLDKGKDDSGT